MLENHKPSTDWLDGTVFLLVTLLGAEFIVFGKPASEIIFAKASIDAIARTRFIWPAVVTVITVVSLDLIRRNTQQLRSILILGTLVGFTGSAASQIYPDFRSPLVLVLHFFFYASIIFAILFRIVLEKSLNKTDHLDSETAKMFFDALMRIIRYILILYAAGIATLEYISNKKNEPADGYITTLFYPTITLIITMAIIFYWVALPFAERFSRNYTPEAPSAPDQ